MKKIKEMLRRIGTAGLAAIMLTVQMPVTAFAEEIAQPQAVVVSDEVLPAKVQTDDVLPGESGGGIIEGTASEESGEDIVNMSKTGDEAVQAWEAPLIEKEASEETADEESSDPVEKQKEGVDAQEEQESDKKDADGDKEKKEQTASEKEERPAFSASKSIDGVRITVEADEGVFPKGATLSVKKVTLAQEKQAEKAVESERDEDKQVAASYTYDIKVLDKDGNEIQPANDNGEDKSSQVKVSFKLDEVADENLTTNVYHITENEDATAEKPENAGNGELTAEKLEVETDGDTAIAETDGFSLYTVEFTYDSKQYVLPGDSEVALSEVLNTAGLIGEVSDVSVSDESLFSAKKCKTAEDGNTPEKDEDGNVIEDENGTWFVFAHKAFNTEEWMKATIGGVVYEITVTDTQSPYGHNGSGTAEDPWQIATAKQWQYFAQDMVNINNSTYGDKYYKLTADITVDTNDTSAIFVGGSTKPFCGHFNGGGHTLTFNYSGMVSGAAPFQYVSGATIENLKVAGTVKINAGKTFAAGIAGYVTGNTTISNCTSSVTISSSSSSSGWFGGLVGSVESWVTLNINNCVFNGSMTGSAELSSGGFVGYNLGTVNITDCLCAPGSIGVGMYSFVNDWTGGSTLTRAYRTKDSSNSLNQGIRVYSSAPAGQLTQKITAADNNSYWMEGAATITGVSDGYAWTGAAITPPSFGVTFNGTPLTNGTDYTAVWTNGASAAVNSFNGLGTYTLTVTGKGSYAGSVTRTVKVESGDGSQEYPYLIGSEADWNSFAAAVNSGNAYSGKYVKLTQDVSVSTMVGNSSDSGTFRGTFLGSNHTLTVNISGSYYAAPFRRVDSATIKDLTVAGTVHESSGFGGSLIGVSYGTTTVSNCRSTASVTFTGYDSGGLVGNNQGTLSIIDCSFKGSMSGTANRGCGFVGNNKSGCSVSITNCLFAPTSAAGGYRTFVRGDGAASVTGSYYTTRYGEAQGTAVTSALPDNSICGKVIACDGQTYYRAACAVTDVNSIYPLGDSAAHPEPTVKDGGATLRKDSDYTLSWNEESAKEGNYTLTVTGAGSYAGAVSISYKVQSGTGTFGGVTFTKGSDDAGEYFIIANANDLRNLSTAVNAGNTPSARFVQTADIDLDGGNFTPIGTLKEVGLNQRFAGIYDGGHHTISGLSVNYNYNGGTMGTELGLFGYIDGGTVRNVRLISPSVQRDSGSPEIGTIAGGSQGTVENCLVIAPTVSNVNNHGAIIGAKDGGTVTNCYFYGGNQSNAIGYGSGTNVNNVGRVYKVTLGENLDISTTYEGDGLDANGFRITSGENKGYYCKAGATVTLAAAPGQALTSASYNDGSNHAITANGGVFSFIMPAADVRVTGSFNALNYTVAFDNNGGAGSMTSMSFSGADSRALTANTFTRAGYEFTGWNTESNGSGTAYADGATVSLLTSTNGATVTLYAQWTKIPATAPTITAFPQDITLSVGYATGGTLSVTATAASGHTLSYQWYSNTAPTTEGGTIINEATATSYAVPTGLAEGNHYYYCVVTATRNDNSDTASVSVAATVTVNAKTDAGVSIDRGTELSVLYGEAAFTLTGLVTSAGTNGAWTWTSDNTDVATVTNGTATTIVTILKASETPINITASYASDTTAGSATLALTVYKKSVTITGLAVSDKVYDGNKTATVTGTAVIDGKIGNDDVTVTAGTAEFADKNVGTDKTVTFSSYTLTGAAAGNYTLSGQPVSVTASITAKKVTVSGITASDKTYDGTTDATLVYTSASFTGKVDGDTLTVSATGAFESADAGDGKTVNISNITLDGADEGNYVLAASGQQTSTTANITPKSITGAAVTLSGVQQEYDGSEKSVSVSVQLGDTVLTGGTDYEVMGTTGTDEGPYSVTVTGKGNYKDTAAAAWEIVRRDANTRTFIGTIDWRDGGRDHTEPPALTLYRTTGAVPEDPAEGEPVTDVTPRWNGDNTIFTYSGLRVFADDDSSYSYWVIENPLDGYEAPVYHNTGTNPKNDRLEKGGTIINYIKQEKIAITGTVTWKHGGNPVSNRPETVTVHLQGNGLDLPYKVITLDGTKDEGSEDVELDPDPIDANTWRFRFDGLDKYGSSTGAEHIYTVREDHVANYTTTYDDSRLNITNTYNTNTAGDILRVRKTVAVPEGASAWTWDDNARFVFGLFGVSNTEGITQPMPSGAVYGDGVYKLIEVNKDSAEHEAGFGAVSFDTPGTYVYSVRELTPAESGTSRLPGMTYDTGAYTVTIIVDEEMNLSTTVTDQAGNTIKSAGGKSTLSGKTNTDSYVLPFTNRFAGTQVDYVMAAGNSYIDPSKLDGDGPPLDVIGDVNGKFGFTMRPVGNNAASAPMPSDIYSSDTGTGLQVEGTDRVYYAKNVNGCVLFGADAAHAIRFTADQPGTYSYELAEVIPDDAVYIGSGFWYNDVDETVYDGMVHTLALKAEEVNNVLTVTLSEDQNDTCLNPGTGTKYENAKNGARQNAADVIDRTGYPRHRNSVPLFCNYREPKIDVTAKKVWDDADDQDGMRPGHVSFLIERSDGQPFRDVYGNILNSEVTIAGTDSANDPLEVVWSNLPRYKRRDDDIYEQITYKVFESANGESSRNSVPGYADQVITGDDEKGFTITNKHVPELRGVAVTMQWNDDDDRDGKRPVGVTFHLDQTKAGELTQTDYRPSVAVSSDDGWKATWLDLPARYGDSSKEFGYALRKEGIPDCYTAEDCVEGKASMQVRIPEGITPLTDKVVVSLTENGSVTGAPIELSRAGSWTGTFEGVLMPSDTGDYSQYGVAIYGTDTGIDSGDLQKTIIRNYTITGTHTPETRDFTVSKVWEMRGAGMVGVGQPDSVQVRLKANGEYLGEAVKLAETDQWQHTWSDLYIYEGGSPIDYTVEELNVPAYYTRSDEQSGDLYKITNTFNIDVTKAPAARPELAYNGDAQDLITAGEASNGTFLYALGQNADTAPADNLYSTSIPTATNAGTYYVWYKVIGDENHDDTTPQPLTASIGKATGKSGTTQIIEVQKGDGVEVSVAVLGFVGTNISLVGTPTVSTTTGSFSVSDYTISSDKKFLTFKVTSNDGGEGNIIVTLDSDNYDDYELTIPVKVQAKTTEVKLESADGVESAVQNVEVTGLDALTKSLNGTYIKVELDVKPENEPTDSGVKSKIDNAVTKIFSGVDDNAVTKEYLDISINQTVDGTEATVTDLESVIEIAVKYDLTGKYNPVVVREHGGSVVRFTALASKPDSGFTDGTHYVDHSTNTIYIYTRYFSTYTIAYTTAVSYTVSFDAQGGSSVNPIVVQKGGTISPLPTTTRSGYSFNGWYTSESGGTMLTTATAITSAQSFYAHWTKNSSGGGGGGVTPTPTKYSVTVTNGSGGGSYAQGTSVTITANAPEEGKRFKEWTGADSLTFTSGSKTTEAATFTMPAQAVSVTATYEDIPAGSYTVSVNGGTGAGEYAEGASVTITANAPEEGKRFKEWTGADGLTFTSGSKTTSSATFTMPAQAVSVTATYEDIPAGSYTVSVNGGTGAGEYAEGESVTITANAPEAGKRFKEWSGADDLTFTSGSRTTEAATFTMPAKAVSLTATYEDIPAGTYTVSVTNDGHGTGSASPAYGPAGTQVTLTASPAVGYHFKEWQVVSGGVSIANNSFVIGEENVMIRAIFEADTPHDHKYKETITKEPTCTEPGIRTYTCECGESYTEEIPALGHDFGEEKVTKEPTCTEAGERTAICSRCGEKQIKEIPALGHDYKEEITKEPTTTVEGMRTFTCTRCGDSYTESIPKLNGDLRLYEKVGRNLTPRSAKKLKVNSSFTLVAQFADEKVINERVVWTSSNPDVAAVTQDGKVTARIGGKTVVTVRSEENPKLTAYCEVFVYEPVTGVELDKKSYSFGTGESVTLTATVLPFTAEQSLIWSTNNAELAVVCDENGQELSGTMNGKQKVYEVSALRSVTVKALKAGSARVTAQATDGSGKKATCSFTIGNPVPDFTISGKNNAKDLAAGKTLAMQVNWIGEKPKNANVSWSLKSADGGDASHIAAISDKGVLTGISEGTVTVTATSIANPNKNASASIVVYVPVKSAALNATSGVVSKANGANGLQLSVNVLSTITGQAATGVALGTAPTVTYSVEKRYEENLSVDKDGLIKAGTKTGRNIPVKATVTAYGGYTKTLTCRVTVKDANPLKGIKLNKTRLSIGEGNTAALTASLNPLNPDGPAGITWESSNSSVVKVDQYGNLTAQKTGTATITAKAKGTVLKNAKETRPSATCKVTVTPSVTGISFTNVSMLESNGLATGKSFAIKTALTSSENGRAASTELLWTSSDESVAEVSNKGVVKAKQPGEVTITAVSKDTKEGNAKAPSASVTFAVRKAVTKVQLDKTKLTIGTQEGSRYGLVSIAKILPADATDPAIEWSANNQKVSLAAAYAGASPSTGSFTAPGTGVRITTKSGEALAVKALEPGVVKLTGTTKDGSNKKVTCTVTIRGQVTELALKTNAGRNGYNNVTEAQKSATISGGDTSAERTNTDDSAANTHRYTSIMKPGTSLTLSPVIQINGMENAGSSRKLWSEYKKYTDVSLSWRSSDTSVATVNKNGKISIKKGTKGKTVTIYAASADGKQTAEVSITVK